MRGLGAILLALLLAGCASSADKGGRFTYRSWDHFAFSAKSNWQIFHYWNASATKRDSENAKRQGGWWGDEVPVEDK
jgi:hypothetical protein